LTVEGCFHFTTPWECCNDPLLLEY